MTISPLPMDYTIPTPGSEENTNSHKRAAMGKTPQLTPNILPKNVPNPMGGVTTDMGSDD